MASGLPPYEEQVLLCGMDREPDHTGLSQRKAYDMIFDALRRALAAALQSGSKRLLATYLQTLLAYPDGCTRGETVFDPQTGNILVQAPPLAEDKLYPKETATGGPGGGGAASRDARCWSTPPTRELGTSPSGWTGF